ncbi:MAG: metallophosphoesterase [Clostridia bacterium]|nr:metallophosphoesterase [Clostridia bacterium]
MRIAFIGDLQYATAEEERLDLKMAQIREQSPDLAIVMGDIGGSHMKSVGGFQETKKYVDMIGCPYEVILGNHDVEYAPFDPVIFDYETVYHDVFPGKELFSVKERDGVLMICVSCERRPPEDFRTHNAVFVSDRRFEAVRSALKAHPGVPTLLVTHAPLAGSGLRRWMPLHAGATDMYLDMTFKAGRWRELAAEFPQIKMSVSAHLHLSHEYKSAITYRGGLMHLSCGVMTVCARDDIFQTRFADVDADGAVIYTLDHSTGEFRRDAEFPFDGEPSGNLSSPADGKMQLGDDLPTSVWKYGGRYYAATEKGLLWEYLPELCEFGGAIMLKGGADEICASEGRLLVRNFAGEVFSFDPESTGRYERIGGCAPPERRGEKAMRGDPLPRADFGIETEKEGNYVVFMADQ